MNGMIFICIVRRVYITEQRNIVKSMVTNSQTFSGSLTVLSLAQRHVSGDRPGGSTEPQTDDDTSTKDLFLDLKFVSMNAVKKHSKLNFFIPKIYHGSGESSSVSREEVSSKTVVSHISHEFFQSPPKPTNKIPSSPYPMHLPG